MGATRATSLHGNGVELNCEYEMEEFLKERAKQREEETEWQKFIRGA